MTKQGKEEKKRKVGERLSHLGYVKEKKAKKDTISLVKRHAGTGACGLDLSENNPIIKKM